MPCKTLPDHHSQYHRLRESACFWRRAELGISSIPSLCLALGARIAHYTHLGSICKVLSLGKGIEG